MPQGKGTYGKARGRPPGKKKKKKIPKKARVFTRPDRNPFDPAQKSSPLRRDQYK